MNRSDSYQPLLFGAALILLLWAPLLLSAGSFTTTIRAGMAFTDWPLSDGSLNPAGWMEERDKFAEHSHRLAAKVLGLLAIVLSMLFYLREGRRSVRWLALLLPLLIILQGILGGLRIHLDPLNTGAVSPQIARTFAVLHALGAQAIFACLALLSLVSSRYWHRTSNQAGVKTRPIPLGVFSLFLIFITIAVGAVTRHTDAGLAIPYFPGANHDGGFFPRTFNFSIGIHFSHRLLAYLATFATAWWIARHWQRLSREKTPRALALGFLLILSLQVALGALIIETLRGEWVTTIHMVNGAFATATFSACLLVVARRSGTYDSSIEKDEAVRREALRDLTKPRLAMLSTLTALAGYGLAPGSFSIFVAVALAAGAYASASGALALNQYMERNSDRLMKRTADRPLPSARLQPGEARRYGILLSVLGVFILALFTTPNTALISALTIVSYLGLYTPMKHRSSWCTHLGGIPGALPPLLGWTAGGAPIDSVALTLFALLYAWQMPHFFAIAAMCSEDYRAAGIRVLTVSDGRCDRLRFEIIFFAIAVLVVSCLPTVLNAAGWWYLGVALALGSWQLYLAIAFSLQPNKKRAKTLFLFTLLYLPAILLAWLLNHAS
ncbi:MAG: heme o synthase [Puniceicoccaceae bacterium]